MSERIPVDRWVKLWLGAVYFSVLGMVVVGGITRLTGSGLSMVEWHPLMGALPPQNEAEWLRVFQLYQGFPQYSEVNSWMALAQFKQIFFWEYVHRLCGRLIGLIVAIPGLVFYLRGRLPAPLGSRVLVAFCLGGAQGLLGWYMVKSGLAGRPEVSHFRLAAHLLLAFVVGHWVLWILLEIRGPAQSRSRLGFRHACRWVLALLTLQIVYGAFMAGTRAGWMSSTFPDMNGHYLPSSALFPGSSVVHDLLNNPLSIHYAHRALGWGTAIAVTGLWWFSREHTSAALTRYCRVAFGVVALQFGSGALTVVFGVPIALAVGHQAGAYLLLSVLVAIQYESRGTIAEG
ncbi:MAG: COX15/CtaA family protein [Polyangiaceae bacterium]|nr:COX15/CtaA family protein [Polyangiaceae bacterium]